MIDPNAQILLIYTGGTIGMMEDASTGSLQPFDFHHIKKHLPELKRFKFQIDHIVFSPVIDSSEISTYHWQELVGIIQKNYDKYDGFVILHGTDTMAYTASALSFMIQNLTKPIVLTGSQLPIGKLRTDAKENLITALEIAADKYDYGRPMVPEVCIFFQNELLRGNRSTKINVDNFNAFKSYNYPNLGKAGIYIKYDKNRILQPDYSKNVEFKYNLSTAIAVIRLFPGIDTIFLKSIVENVDIKAIILETYGSGNAPLNKNFLDLFENAVQSGKIIVNITQCEIGCVDMHHYNTGQSLANIGILSGFDMTFEAISTKLMYLYGQQYELEKIKAKLTISLSGELSRLEERINEKIQ